MQTILSVNQRDSLTLPKEVRERVNLKIGEHLILEEGKEGEVILRVALTFPAELYSDERIAEFEKENEEALSRFSLK